MKRSIFLACLFFILLINCVAFAGNDLSEKDLPKEEVAYLPKVVIPPFSAREYEPDSKSLGAILADLLMVKLGNTLGLVLVDRSAVEQISQEVSLTMQGLVDSENAIQIGKMAGADITVTGFVSPAAEKKVIVIKAVQTDSGIIRNIARYAIDEDNLGTTVNTLAQFVHNALKISLENDKTRFFAVGGFTDQSSTKAQIRRGAEISAFIEKRYSLNANVGVVVRSQMNPILLEESLHKLDRIEGKERPDSVQRGPRASVVIDGDYKVDPNDNLLQVRVEIVGDITKSMKFRASSWDDLMNKMGYALDDVLQVHQYNIADSQLQKAKILFEEGLKLSGLSFRSSTMIGMDTYQLGENFVDGRYQKDTSQEQKQQNIMAAIGKFKKAIGIYPNYYKAMLPLAFCLLSKEFQQEGRANALLEKIVFGATDRTLKGSAISRLRDRNVTVQAFSEFVDNPEGLIQDLINNDYINQDGFISRDFPTLKKADQMKLGRDFLGARDEIFSILKISSYYAWKEKSRTMGQEEHVHFSRGMQRCNITYEKRSPPRLNTKNIGGDYPDWMRLKNIYEAIESFESVLFLNPKNYQAMLFLASCLKDSRINQIKRANELFNLVVEGAADEGVRFMAADALDKIEETNFSDLFTATLFARDYPNKKYFAELRQLVQERKSHPGKVSLVQLLDAYEKSIVASCWRLMGLYQKHGDSGFIRYIRKNVAPFVEMTKESMGNKAIAERRKKILADMWRDYPLLAPHYIIACDIQGSSELNEQRELLSLIENKDRQPLILEAFFEELGNRIKDCLEDGRYLGAGLKMGELIRKNNSRDVKNNIYLAYAYHKLGNFEESRWLVEELVDGKVELASAKTTVTKDDFTGIQVDPAILLAKLKQKNYLDQKNRLTLEFIGLNNTFKEDLANYDEHVMEQVASALDRGRGIRIISTLSGEKDYFLFQSDPLEKWLKILQKESKRNRNKPYLWTIVKFPQDEIIGDIVADKGVMWITTHQLDAEAPHGYSNPKVYRSYGGRTPSRLELPFEPKGEINAVAVRDDTVWLGTDEGLLELYADRKGYQFYAKAKGLPNDRVASLALTENRLYLGLSQGVGYMDLENKQYHSINNEIEVLEIAVSPNNGLWVLSRESGLYHYGSVENKLVRRSELSRITGAVSLAAGKGFAVMGLNSSLPRGDFRSSGDGEILIYDDTRETTDRMAILGPAVLSLAFVGETLWLGGKDFLAVIDVAEKQIINKKRNVGRNFGSLYLYNHGVLVGVDNELFFSPKILTEKQRRDFTAPSPESYPEYFRVVTEGTPPGYSGNKLDGLYEKNGVHNGYPRYVNITGKGWLFYCTTSERTSWALGPQVGNSPSSILSNAPLGARPDYFGTWTNPYIAISAAGPLDPVFVDTSDYQVAGFPEQGVNGIYKAAGNGPLGYPYFLAESGEYSLRFKRLRKTENGKWEVLENAKRFNNTRYYSKKAVRIKVRPDGPVEWVDAKNKPVLGTIQKISVLSSSDPDGDQDNIDVEKKYYLSGKLRSEKYYRNGLKHGVFKNYYEDGTLSSTTPYENGQLHGVKRRYYKNGQVIIEASYKGGKKDGVWREFYEKGFSTEVTYKNNEQVTHHKRFYEDGSLFKENNKGMGEKEEIFREYQRNGKLSYEGFYDVGKEDKDGIAIFYHRNNGRLDRIWIYENGKIVGSLGYDYQGKLLSKRGPEKHHLKYSRYINKTHNAPSNAGVVEQLNKDAASADNPQLDNPQEQRKPR